MKEGVKTLERQLFEAAESGNLALCRKLITSGANVDARDTQWFSFTALHKAAQNGHMEVCRALLAAGAQVDLKCSRAGETPLCMAVAGGCADAVKLLVEHGANVNFKNEHGIGPLYEAHDAEAVQILIAAGAKLSARCKAGYTPLHGAAIHDRPDVCRALVEAGANVSDNNRGAGLTPFQRAVAFGMIKAARYFVVEGGETINQVTHNGTSLLDLAGSAHMTELLLAARSERAIAGELVGQDPCSSSLKRQSFSPL
jgi:ankyrin repeat protein